jgi:hypothetical protein
VISSEPKVSVFKYPIEFIVNVADAPEMKEWANKVASVCERNYAMINDELWSEGFKPPTQITMTLKNNYKGVAAASGGRITGSVSYNPLVAPPLTLDRTPATMRRAIIDDQEQALGITVRFMAQNLRHHAAERTNAGPRFTTSQHDAPLHIPGRQILQRTLTLILRFDAPRAARSRRLFRMAPPSRLDARLLVTRQDVVAWPQRLAFPYASVQIQHAPRFLGEQRITRENPVLVLPRLDGMLV